MDIDYFLEHLEYSWKYACADKNNKHMQRLAKKISRSWTQTLGDGAARILTAAKGLKAVQPSAQKVILVWRQLLLTGIWQDTK